MAPEGITLLFSKKRAFARFEKRSNFDDLVELTGKMEKKCKKMTKKIEKNVKNLVEFTGKKLYPNMTSKRQKMTKPDLKGSEWF